MRDNWTEEQITIVLYEYCRRPFGQFNGTKQFVIDLGNLLGRSPGAIVRKVGNLASFDVGGVCGVDGLEGSKWIMLEHPLPQGIRWQPVGHHT